jgi:hypothetical protein
MYGVTSVKDTKEGTFVKLPKNNKERSGMGNEKKEQSEEGCRGTPTMALCVCFCECVLSYDSMILREVKGGC